MIRVIHKDMQIITDDITNIDDPDNELCIRGTKQIFEGVFELRTLHHQFLLQNDYFSH